ncbi:MAG: hypothetical protein AB9866_11100 [Syntrophobacteraceae bacterium]
MRDRCLQIAIFLFIPFFIFGCVPAPPAHYSIEPSKTYHAGFDDVWSAIIEVFAEKNISIKSLEKQSGIIAADDSRIAVTPAFGKTETEFCDCGDPGAFLHFSEVRVRFNVFVRILGPNECSVRINSSFEAMKRYGYDVVGWDPCVSKGTLESRFFTALEGKLR